SAPVSAGTSRSRACAPGHCDAPGSTSDADPPPPGRRSSATCYITSTGPDAILILPDPQVDAAERSVTLGPWRCVSNHVLGAEILLDRADGLLHVVGVVDQEESPPCLAGDELEDTRALSRLLRALGHSGRGGGARETDGVDRHVHTACQGQCMQPHKLVRA